MNKEKTIFTVKKLFGHINHRQLLNEYVLHNFFAFYQEASYIVLWKPNLNEQKDFERLVLFRKVSHGAIDDIMQAPKKEVRFFFFSVCCIVFNCS